MHTVEPLSTVFNRPHSTHPRSHKHTARASGSGARAARPGKAAAAAAASSTMASCKGMTAASGSSCGRPGSLVAGGVCGAVLPRPRQAFSSRAATRVRASSREDPREELRRLEDERVNMRAEAEAPFRTLRLVIYGFSVASAGVGSLISLPQLAGALRGARGALQVEDVLTNIAVNVSAVAIFAFLFRQDWMARQKQLARLGRESALAAQRVRLANGKRVALRDLQGTSRVVLLAGSPTQVAKSLAEAESYREQLVQRGVFLVPLPIFEEQPPADGASTSGGEQQAAAGGIPPLEKGDLRWRGAAEGAAAYRQWFADQLAYTPAKVTSETGLYVGLRLDGRVRASGMGGAPWPRMVAELAPLEGDKKWSGFMSGFDGDSAPR
ncbi:MAG: hypothetical protein J3K34DRAFT_461212 [Monoraphidium minutum]|nr:MAG: hypothetical protein J3K34DRAFT_461212 [Monoraphidium minutum]